MQFNHGANTTNGDGKLTIADYDTIISATMRNLAQTITSDSSLTQTIPYIVHSNDQLITIMEPTPIQVMAAEVELANYSLHN